MKFFFLTILIAISLDAQTIGRGISATVIAKYASIYQKPYECSAKKVNYFKRGDKILVDYCNQYRWCKTKHGFVKRDKLSLKLPKSVQQPRKVIAPQFQNVQRTSMQSSYLLPPKKPQKKEKRLKLIPYVNCEKDIEMDHYDAYFTPQSSELLLDDNTSL